MPETTIAALSTPAGTSALAVIRLSGPDAASICDQGFLPYRHFPRASAMAPYTLAPGKWCAPSGELLDQIVLAAYKAPHSYTGEDMFELSCHGGSAVREAILESLYAYGASPAMAGEFSKRAFLNGKLDLMQAEAVMDLIDADSALAQHLALSELGGSLSRAVQSLSGELRSLMAEIEDLLEFDDLADVQPSERDLLSKVQQLQQRIYNVLASWKQGRVVSDAFRVSILGLPNAGKSSLFNALLGSERAIVDPSSGTTRDTLEARLRIGGIPVLLIDTAGLRESADSIEAEGIQRAIRSAGDADLLLWLHDPTAAERSRQALQDYLREHPQHAPLLLVAGKADLLDAAAREAQSSFLASVDSPWPLLFWSKWQAACPDVLRSAVQRAYEALGTGFEGQLLLHNLRHKDLLERTAEALDLAAQSLREESGLDITETFLHHAQEALYTLSGEQIEDDLVEEIFARFCVGK